MEIAKIWSSDVLRLKKVLLRYEDQSGIGQVTLGNFFLHRYYVHHFIPTSVKGGGSGKPQVVFKMGFVNAR